MSKTYFMVIGVNKYHDDEDRFGWKEGDQFFLINRIWGGTSATLTRIYKNGFPKDTKVFETREDAEAFIKTWVPHPLGIYPQPKKDGWSVVEVRPRCEEVVWGFDPIKEERNRTQVLSGYDTPKEDKP